MSRTRHNFEVCNPIVGLVAVFMMNYLIMIKRPSDVSLHHNAVLATTSVRTVFLRSQYDVTIGVIRLATTEVPVVLATPAYDFALQAAAAFRNALSQRPPFDDLFSATVTPALPVMQSSAFSSVSGNYKTAISVSDQIGDLIDTTVA